MILIPFYQIGYAKNFKYNMYKVSIIIPIYKTEAYIGACLDSIFEQECDIAEIECLLVNDCTPDKSMEIVEQKIKTRLLIISISH